MVTFKVKTRGSQACGKAKQKTASPVEALYGLTVGILVRRLLLKTIKKQRS